MALQIQSKDTTYTKIFVGGLPYHTTDSTLREYFQQFGDLEEAVVITDRQTSKSRGYGFVTMTDKLSAECACKDPNPIIDGRKANVNLAYMGAKPRIPAAELMLAYSFPFGLKTGLPAGYVGAHMSSIPQFVYASPYHTTPTNTGFQFYPNTLTAGPATPSFYDYSQTPTGVAAATAAMAAAAASPAVAKGYSPFTGGLDTPCYPQFVQSAGTGNYVPYTGLNAAPGTVSTGYTMHPAAAASLAAANLQSSPNQPTSFGLYAQYQPYPPIGLLRPKLQ